MAYPFVKLQIADGNVPVILVAIPSLSIRGGIK
jgi:hypothetical protein